MCDIFTDCRWMNCFGAIMTGVAIAIVWWTTRHWKE